MAIIIINLYHVKNNMKCFWQKLLIIYIQLLKETKNRNIVYNALFMLNKTHFHIEEL